jgi:hypothetical protein
MAALDYEVAQEQASALGRAGRALEAALAALSEYDRIAAPQPDGRGEFVQQAADALWRFLVQREAIGLRDARPVIRDYRVPAEVQNRVGIFGARRSSGPA